MTHPRNADDPHKPAGTKSAAERKNRAEQMDRAEKRARRRFRIVRWVYDQEIEDRPHTQIHAQVEEAIDQGDLLLDDQPVDEEGQAAGLPAR